MRIGINLATRPFADLGPVLKNLRIAMGVLVLVALALGAGIFALDQKAAQARAKEHAVDLQIAQITQERQKYQAMMREPQNAAVLSQAQNLNHLFDEKAFSWTLAMEDLETVLPGGVQVTTLEPARDKDGHITLHLRVVGPRDRSIQLVQNLEHSRRFMKPRIVGETSESNGGPNMPVEPVSASNRVNFDVLADYNPAAPGERRPTKTAASHEMSDDVPTLRAVPPMQPGERRAPYTGVRPVAPQQPARGGVR